VTLISKERTIMFADVADSTAIYEKLGDIVAAKAIDTCLAELSAIAIRANGTIVKTIGDEIMVAFLTADAACIAAKKMQEAMQNRLPVQGIAFAIKVGFHHGNVLEDRMDFWGDGVNVAARLAALARRGEILTSDATVDALSDTFKLDTRDLDAHNVKGKQEAVRVFEVVWEQDPDATHLVTRVSTTKSSQLFISLVGHEDAAIAVTQFPYSMGRGANCSLVVAEPNASRNHARIECRDQQFVLVDDSTNGTYVTMQNSSEILIRRESVLLRGEGKMSLGTSLVSAQFAIAYRLS
jgi:adenylate cyclase